MRIPGTAVAGLLLAAILMGGWAPAEESAGLDRAPAEESAGLAAPRNLRAQALSTSAIQLGWSGRAGGAIEFHVEMAPLGGSFSEVAVAATTSALVPGLAPATGYSFRVRAHGAGGFSPYSSQVMAATLGPVAPCLPDAHTLCLHGGRFRASASWATAAASGTGSVVQFAADDSGLLWFFQPANWELLVKVIDGCAVNERFWVFFGATTDVQYTVTVADSETGAAQVYFHALGAPATSVNDTGALSVCP